MTDQELRKLTRKDLLEMLLKQSEEIQELKEKLNQAEAALQERTIKLEQAGSIAEASLQLNGVFEAAQSACQQYIESIQKMKQHQEDVCTRTIKESQTKVDSMLQTAKTQSAELKEKTETQCAALKEKTETQCAKLKEKTETQCAALKEKTEAQCAELVQKAKEESQSYWDEVSSKLHTFVAEHAALEKLFAVIAENKTES